MLNVAKSFRVIFLYEVCIDMANKIYIDEMVDNEISKLKELSYLIIYSSLGSFR